MSAQNPTDEGRSYILRVNPGIQRDGTTFASRSWIDGQWCRFQRGLPRKIGGYESIVTDLANIPRGIILVNNSPNFNMFVGDQASLTYWTIDENGNVLSGPNVGVTPVPFPANPNYLWTFDTMFYTINSSNVLIAHPGANLSAIDSTINTPVYYGNPLVNVPFIPAVQPNTSPTDPNFPTLNPNQPIVTSGGVVVLHPVLLIFGNDGFVQWTYPNSPNRILNNARVTGTKIVAGLPTRGGNSSPAGLLWSLDSLIRVTQTGTDEIDFTFDTVTSQSSILSSSSVIQYDSEYYWIGGDRFLGYNGTVFEVPNNMNLNYFFNNLNFSQSQKIWSTKVTQYGEIWHFYPSNLFPNSNECNAVLIHNLRENTWYDSQINRSCGIFDETFAQPIWCDNVPGSSDIWLQESGVDQVAGEVVTAIPFLCQTGNMAYCAVAPDGNTPGLDRWIDLYRLEPDAIQSGNMTLVVSGKRYARSTVQTSDPYTFGSDQEKIDLREQRREMTLIFQNAMVGGDFQMGQMLMVMRVGDARQ